MEAINSSEPSAPALIVAECTLKMQASVSYETFVSADASDRTSALKI
jgi:hypothetical protein